MPQIITTRSTYQSAITENTLVRQVDDQLALLEPNETPLVTFLMKMKKRFPVYTPRYEWPEDDFVARWGQVAAAAGGSATTAGSVAPGTAGHTLVVLDGTQFVVGDTVAVPVVATSSAVPEVFLVTGVAGNTLTITRGIGSVDNTGAPLNVGNIALSSPLRILAPAYAEGANVPNPKSTALVMKKSYTQIFRTSLALTKTQAAVKQYGKPSGERKYEQKKKLIEHKQKLNAAALFGTGSEDMTGPIRTTTGINNVIRSNVTNGNGTLTEKTFEAFARQCFRYGSTQKLLLAAPMIISAIHYWGNNRQYLGPAEKVYGVDIQRVITGHGTFLLARDWMLEDGVTAGTGFGSLAYSIDLDECSYFYLEGNGQSRDTRLLENVQPIGQDSFIDEILTEGGFQFRFEKKHAKLFNVTDFS